MTAHAVDAARAARACRCWCCAGPGWPPEPGLAPGRLAADAAAAAAAVAGRARLPHHRPHGLAAFAGLDLEFLVRCVDPPAPPLPAPACRCCSTAGPFTVEGERALMREHRHRRAGHQGQRRPADGGEAGRGPGGGRAGAHGPPAAAAAGVEP